jgi:4-hydroxybenzoate polyprenyltransferase
MGSFMMEVVKKYIQIARIDHWVKNSFIIPGVVVAIFLIGSTNSEIGIIFKFLIGFLSTCFISSANYIINEWLDREFDKNHPTKKDRTCVVSSMKAKYVILEYVLFIVIGISCSYL